MSDKKPCDVSGDIIREMAEKSKSIINELREQGLEDSKYLALTTSINDISVLLDANESLMIKKESLRMMALNLDNELLELRGLELIASVYLFGVSRYHIYENKIHRKYYKQSLFDNDPYYIEELDRDTVVKICSPWFQLEENRVFYEIPRYDSYFNLCKFSEYKNKHICTIGFYYFCDSFTEIYGFGKTQKEAQKQCISRLKYFLRRK